MTEPDLRCFLVALQWNDGTGSLNAFVTRNEAHAGAVAVTASMRAEPQPTGDLIAVMHHELPLAWLRWAVRALETGQATTRVLSLVPDAEAGPNTPEPTGEA